ncbi:FUSC family protein [Hymenobacter radiodurans]|uniref:FUSC family protein n=1 Tax=Hymenobacter radiodurans TaxID=2496028 RepID=UPI0010589024|nr:FUSC family protein [Hymenobacter radiodurans]
MSDKKDYSELTLEELLIEEKKVKKNAVFSAGLIGFMVGIMIYGIVTKGFGFLYIAIPLFLILLIYKNSQIQKQNLKQIQAEIDVRNLKQDRLDY